MAKLKLHAVLFSLVVKENGKYSLYGWSDLSGSCSFKWFRDIEVKQYKNVPPRVKGCLFASDSQSSSLMISEVLMQSPQSSTSVCSDEMPNIGDPTEDSRQNSSIYLKCHCLFEKKLPVHTCSF
ncbi:uncharacterized protein LOC128237965 [Mya arenaria]|uniref:uncharacterized protein LOC128237965 n=1 Tax=Mya arenaria TaxID=6604 RepID=UPI0022E3BE8A|nr:uncharacterized protein LOC128237965 [Mya arenaria]XP_052809508.1 uncharacterized protein LOC128237965 [Mya arenaria]XP_052809515.1 uncharacterized protein LOC128237965 [Mya arenaria]